MIWEIQEAGYILKIFSFHVHLVLMNTLKMLHSFKKYALQHFSVFKLLFLNFFMCLKCPEFQKWSYLHKIQLSSWHIEHPKICPAWNSLVRLFHNSLSSLCFPVGEAWQWCVGDSVLPAAVDLHLLFSASCLSLWVLDKCNSLTVWGSRKCSAAHDHY